LLVYTFEQFIVSLVVLLENVSIVLKDDHLLHVIFFMITLTVG